MHQATETPPALRFWLRAGGPKPGAVAALIEYDSYVRHYEAIEEVLA